MKLILTNPSPYPITYLSPSLVLPSESCSGGGQLSTDISWDEAALQSELPLASGGKIVLPLRVVGVGSFVAASSSG